MSFVQQAEGDVKTIGNNYLLNAGALYVFDTFIAPYVVDEQSGKRILMSAGLITGIEEAKQILMRAGYDIRVFNGFIRRLFGPQCRGGKEQAQEHQILGTILPGKSRK